MDEERRVLDVPPVEDRLTGDVPHPVPVGTTAGTEDHLHPLAGTEADLLEVRQAGSLAGTVETALRHVKHENKRQRGGVYSR